MTLSSLPAATPYTFALAALDVLFTKQELSKSLMYATKRSDKQALDETKVAKIISK